MLCDKYTIRILMIFYTKLYMKEIKKHKWYIQGSVVWCTSFGTGKGNLRVSSASNISTLCRWNNELGSSRTGSFAAQALPFVKSQE